MAVADHLADVAEQLTEQRDHYAKQADNLEAEGLDAMAERLLAETNLRSMDFRNGMSMEIEPARALAANFVGAARAMLGDAENYSETPVEMTTSLAVDPENPATWEKFAFIVQRVAPGKLTPHEARRQAEAERDKAVAELAETRRLMGLQSADYDRLLTERDHYRERLAETDQGATILALEETIAAADAERDHLENRWRDEHLLREQAEADRDRLAEQVQGVRDLHRPDRDAPQACVFCAVPYPCTTIRALDGNDREEGGDAT